MCSSCMPVTQAKRFPLKPPPHHALQPFSKPTNPHATPLAMIDPTITHQPNNTTHQVDQDLLQGPSSELNLAAPAPKSEADVVLLPNGCLCCKARTDLVEAFLRVLEMNQASGEGQRDRE